MDQRRVMGADQLWQRCQWQTRPHARILNAPCTNQYARPQIARDLYDKSVLCRHRWRFKKLFLGCQARNRANASTAWTRRSQTQRKPTFRRLFSGPHLGQKRLYHCLFFITWYRFFWRRAYYWRWKRKIGTSSGHWLALWPSYRLHHANRNGHRKCFLVYRKSGHDGHFLQRHPVLGCGVHRRKRFGSNHSKRSCKFLVFVLPLQRLSAFTWWLFGRRHRYLIRLCT